MTTDNLHMRLESHITVGHSGRIFVSITYSRPGKPVDEKPVIEDDTIHMVFDDLDALLAGITPSSQNAARNIVAALSKRLRPSDDRPIVLVHDGSLESEAFCPPYCPLVYEEGMTLEDMRKAYGLVRATLGYTPLRAKLPEEDASFVRGAWVVPAEAIGTILSAKGTRERKLAAERVAIERIGAKIEGSRQSALESSDSE